MSFPQERSRRLRQNPMLRALTRETKIDFSNLVQPIFVRSGKSVRSEIEAMPGQFQLSPDQLVEEARELHALGIPAVILFGIPDKKDPLGKSAYSQNGIAQTAVKLLRKKVPEMLVITDVCLCQYTSHGHCGVLAKKRDGSFAVDNDKTLELLARTAVSHARAGAHIVAPSAMMDGQVKAIREALDESGFAETPILSYAAKFASSFYGPFREAAGSKPSFGDRTTYQMDFANGREALKEVRLDLEEKADMVMVKPALAYLDIIKLVKEKFDVPVAAYNVSGEYSMVKAAASRGWIDEKKVTLEIITAIKRAGADIILTYHAKEIAKWLRGEKNVKTRK